MMDKLLSRTKTTNLRLLKKNRLDLFDTLECQLKQMLEINWNHYTTTHVPPECIFITYIENTKDLVEIKELYENEVINLNTPEHKIYIDGINVLLIGFVMIHKYNDYYDFKYNKKFNYIELIECLIAGVGIGSRIIKKVEQQKKKILIPLIIIKESKHFWLKHLYPKLYFTDTKHLIKITKELSLSYEIKWRFLQEALNEICSKIVKQLATDFVAKILKI
jgi:hypothetical protein